MESLLGNFLPWFALMLCFHRQTLLDEENTFSELNAY